MAWISFTRGLKEVLALEEARLPSGGIRDKEYTVVEEEAGSGWSRQITSTERNMPLFSSSPFNLPI